MACVGKTYTMSGSAAEPGVHARVAAALFASLAATGDGGCIVEVAMMEIYCETIRDLLAPTSAAALPAADAVDAGGEGTGGGAAAAAASRGGGGSPERLDVSGLGAGQLAHFQERVPGLAWEAVATPDDALVRLLSGSPCTEMYICPVFSGPGPLPDRPLYHCNRTEMYAMQMKAFECESSERAP